MKFLLVLGVVLFGIWLWKHNRRADKVAKEAAPRAPAPPQPTHPSPAHMVACAHCGLHLPQHDAVLGDKGAYCSEAHRNTKEG